METLNTIFIIYLIGIFITLIGLLGISYCSVEKKEIFLKIFKNITIVGVTLAAISFITNIIIKKLLSEL